MTDQTTVDGPEMYGEDGTPLIGRWPLDMAIEHARNGAGGDAPYNSHLLAALRAIDLLQADLTKVWDAMGIPADRRSDIEFLTGGITGMVDRARQHRTEITMFRRTEQDLRDQVARLERLSRTACEERDAALSERNQARAELHRIETLDRDALTDLNELHQAAATELDSLRAGVRTIADEVDPGVFVVEGLTPDSQAFRAHIAARLRALLPADQIPKENTDA